MSELLISTQQKNLNTVIVIRHLCLKIYSSIGFCIFSGHRYFHRRCAFQQWYLIVIMNDQNLILLTADPEREKFVSQKKSKCHFRESTVVIWFLYIIMIFENLILKVLKKVVFDLYLVTTIRIMIMQHSRMLWNIWMIYILWFWRPLSDLQNTYN